MATRDIIGRISERARSASRRGPELERDREAAPDAEREAVPLGGTRAEAMQRLQVGLTGLLAMIAVTGFANMIGSQAEQAEEAAVPDALPSTEPTAASPQRDPLADAGVVPEMPAENEETQAEPGEAATIRRTAPDGSITVTVPDTPPTARKPRGDKAVPPDAP